MKLFILIFSFVLDGILSNYLPINGFLTPLFTVISLIVVYPYFKGNKREYYKYSLILGLSYDLIYTDTMIFYAILFLIIASIITKLTKVLSDTYLNLTIITIIVIITFRTITYISMVITGNLIFNVFSLLKGIYSSLLINIIYALLLTFITNYINYKLNTKKHKWI